MQAHKEISLLEKQKWRDRDEKGAYYTYEWNLQEHAGKLSGCSYLLRFCKLHDMCIPYEKTCTGGKETPHFPILILKSKALKRVIIYAQ